MIRNNQEFADLMEKILNKSIKQLKKKRIYGDGVLLSRVEIHTIVTIGDNLGINLVSLANIKGVTKGAASQMIYKLVNKGLVIKTTSEHSDKEIQLWLTDNGKKCYLEHQKFHENNNINIYEMLDDLSDELYQELKKFLITYDKILE